MLKELYLLWLRLAAPQDLHYINGADTLPPPLPPEQERAALRGAVGRLSPRERRIMELRFGLNHETEHTQKEVADTLGISQSYISRLEKRIIRRLRRELEAVG